MDPVGYESALTDKCDFGEKTERKRRIIYLCVALVATITVYFLI